MSMNFTAVMSVDIVAGLSKSLIDKLDAWIINTLRPQNYVRRQHTHNNRSFLTVESIYTVTLQEGVYTFSIILRSKNAIEYRLRLSFENCPQKKFAVSLSSFLLTQGVYLIPSTRHKFYTEEETAFVNQFFA
jgi:hypothetical protein